MKYILIVLTSFIFLQPSAAQDLLVSPSVVDSLYKEDQFYFGITYNLLTNMPKGMSQNGFSSGFHFGFIKDMPINKNRNWAIGLGLGYSANSINQDLLISKDQQGVFSYQLLEDSQFTKNKFSRHLLEVPFELRWRTSTPESYKFWRIYTGFKLSYLFASSSKHKGASQNSKIITIDDFDKLQYGLTLSVGYNTWNAYLYYGLNPIFNKEALLDGKAIDLKTVKVGLLFYIL
jgi:hypothetical protein